MKLVLYSGGDESENEHLDWASLELTNLHPSKVKIAYIPSCSFDSHGEFRNFAKQFSSFGVHRIFYFPIDVPFDNVLLREVLNCDIIHLSGGNTFYFLRQLRRQKIIGELKGFVRNGGVLTGLSAGAILMTPTIRTAGFPEFDRDENDENLKNLKAMNLCRFEFFPHYKKSRRYHECLLKESRYSEHPIYACPDGNGIVVNDTEIYFLGRSFAFFRGKSFTISR